MTLTLPETIIDALTAIDTDISRAVVRLATKKGTSAPPLSRAAELAVFGRQAVITIRPTSSLRARTGIELVPLPDGRALISFDHPTSIADLELVLNDALDDASLSAEDRSVYEGIVAILRDARRSTDVELLSRSIIVLQRSPRRRTAVLPAMSNSKARRG